MGLKQRRITYLLFFLVFSLAAPLLLYFALGYRLNFSNGQIFKVGAAYIKSFPEGAKIYNNNIYTKQKTPNQIINLMPGKNLIKVQKDSYQDWQKEIEINAGTTTFIEDIVLFLQQFKTKELGNGTDQLISSRNHQSAALTKNNIIYFLSLATPQLMSDYQGKKPIQLIELSDDGTLILFQEAERYYSYNRGGLNKLTDIGRTLTAPIDHVAIRPNTADVWFLANNKMYQINPTTAAVSPIVNLDIPVTDFALTDDYFWTLDNQNNLTLHNYDASVKSTVKLSGENNPALLSAHSQWCLVKADTELWLIENDQIREKFTASQYDWQNEKILIGSKYELWLYNTSLRSNTLIDRSSIPFDKILWHPSLSYFALVQNNTLSLVEIDNRWDQRHRIDIQPISADSLFSFNQKGDQLLITNSTTTDLLTIQ